MALEREIKLRFDSADEARERILALGATPLLGRRLQEDCLFDTEDERLRLQRSTLRVPHSIASAPASGMLRFTSASIGSRCGDQP